MKRIMLANRVAFLILFCGLNTAPSLAESIDYLERKSVDPPRQLDQAPLSSRINFSVIVFDQAGWSEDEIRRIVGEASQIFIRECRVNLNPVSFEVVNVRHELQLLSPVLQEQLVRELKSRQRPIVFFINETESADFAYAYLEETVSPSQGTAWITQRSSVECRGVLLAHELGHITLRHDGHDAPVENLMSATCRLSNVSNQPLNTRISPEQCQLLWKRYADTQVSGKVSEGIKKAAPKDGQ